MQINKYSILSICQPRMAGTVVHRRTQDLTKEMQFLNVKLLFEISL